MFGKRPLQPKDGRDGRLLDVDTSEGSQHGKALHHLKDPLGVADGIKETAFDVSI